MNIQKNINLPKKVKPYFKSKDFYLYKNDCIEVLKKIPENSIDMIFADPPYFLSNNGFSIHAGKRVSVNKGDWDKSQGVEMDFKFHVNWIQACKRVLKPKGTIWISGTYHSIYQCGYALQLLDFKVLNDISWYKPNASPNLSCRYFTASQETIIWAIKDRKSKHNFNYKIMKDWDNNYKMEAVYNGEKSNNKKISIPIEVMHKTGKQMRSVWAITTPKKSEKTFGKHPTQKPIELLRRIVLASTKEGDTILDPFTGSSTTGIACEIIGNRNFIGIDMEKKYLKLSVDRFKELKKNTVKNPK